MGMDEIPASKVAADKRWYAANHQRYFSRVIDMDGGVMAKLLSRQWLGIAIVLVVVSCLIVFGYYEWPGLHVDAPMYSTAAINLARGFGWHYGGYTDRLLWKPDGLYDHHGVLQALLYGFGLKTTNWWRYSAANTLVNIVTYLVSTFLLSRILRRGLAVPCLPLAAIAALVPTMLQLGVQGRPEHLLTPLMLIPCLVYELSGSAKRCFWATIPTTGLILLTSPVVGLMSMVLIATVLLASLPLRKSLIKGLLLLVGSLFVAATILQIATPFNLTQWARNMSQASKTWVLSFRLEGNLAAFKSNIFGGSFPSLFWNWTIFFIILVAIATLIEKRRFLSLALLIGTGYYIADRASDYNYIAFIPLAWLVFCDFNISRRLAILRQISMKDHRLIIVSVSLLYMAWFIVYALVASEIALSGSHARHARSLLHEQIPKSVAKGAKQAVAYDYMHMPSFVVLGTPFEEEGVEFVDSSAKESEQCTAGEMAEFESKFKVKFAYYIHPQHANLVSIDDKKVNPMPNKLCVGGKRFFLKGGINNAADSGTLLSRVLPGRFKHFYSYALYKSE